MDENKAEIIKQSSIIRFRQAMDSDLDYIMETEHAEENAQYVIPWPKEEHARLLNIDNTKHFIVETADGFKKVGFVIVSGLKNPFQEIEFMRIIMADKGKGYGRETVKMLQAWAFEDLGAHRAWLDVKEYNDRARNLYKSEGFIEEGRIRDCIKTGDRYESLIILAILEDEYLEKLKKA
ncbi:GNAT family N-acetyltransferase [Dendrosporobacter sp. 1207_IL3150]|uniref:GNAT family N-acetyltransferase n=1 Tax=Dendrosporobacter sp. 1207_IL3150 TaxID=3084054 RepID=UPI002FD9201E